MFYVFIIIQNIIFKESNNGFKAIMYDLNGTLLISDSIVFLIMMKIIKEVNDIVFGLLTK